MTIAIVELADLLHAMPEPGTFDPDDILADVRDDVDRKRKQYADDLTPVPRMTPGPPSDRRRP
ncbi:hypothetical protein ACFYNX_26180 [Streptomyces sp. NPDC007872]|uniref:hypothetical protein n=1 Tax=Streptomyces sp. NPDC007872 TaxID=3364782 RepID=UPI00369EFD72